MKRRDVLKGIFGITAISLSSYYGTNYFFGVSTSYPKDIRKYSSLISQLVEVIIPSSDTPGAKEAQVHNFIIGYFENCASRKDYKNFINGLIDIESESENRYNQSFKDCREDEKYLLLKELDDSSNNHLIKKISNKIRGRSFFDLLKSLTIEGYCTSEVGVTKFLRYQPVPGNYQAITNISSNQKAWATK